MGEGDGEGAAEAAALFVLAEGGDDGVFDRFQQREGGLAAVSAATVAGAVEGDTGGFLKFSGPGFDAEAVVNEVHDFPSATGEGVDRLVGIFLKLEEISVKVHGGTGAGGDDHREVAGEDFGTMLRDFARGGPIAGVESGLAAARLVFGEFDGDS